MKTKNDAGERLLSAWLTLSSTLWNERIVTGMTFNEAFVCNLVEDLGEEKALHAADIVEEITQSLKKIEIL